MKIKQLKKLLPAGAYYGEMASPVGTLTIITTAQGVHAILWDNQREQAEAEDLFQQLKHSAKEPILATTKQQLNEYFNGERKAFDLPLKPQGTHFQHQAWQQLLKIPYASTISYGEQAQRLGDKNKARAVGLANGCNPISIIIPCHRVIGKSGALVGFGGGLNNKSCLLDLEQQYQSM